MIRTVNSLWSLFSLLGSAAWWLLAKLYGDALFTTVRAMIPEWLLPPTLDGGLDWVVSYGPTLGLAVLGIYFFAAAQQNDHALAAADQPES